jgi:hypothetical protein
MGQAGRARRESCSIALGGVDRLAFQSLLGRSGRGRPRCPKLLLNLNDYTIPFFVQLCMLDELALRERRRIVAILP